MTERAFKNRAMKLNYELTPGVCEQLAKFVSDGMWQLESPPPAAYIRTC